MVKEILVTLDEKMSKTISVLKEELGRMKAGRANPKMLEKVEAEYYGSLTPVTQLANVSVPEARILLIQPYDKTSIREIEKAILKSDLGLNPTSDGTVIRLLIPELTEETRKTLVKNIRKVGEDAKVALRSIRHDANNKVKTLKKNKDITEDEAKEAEAKVQTETDKYAKVVDKLIDEKEKEVMTI